MVITEKRNGKREFATGKPQEKRNIPSRQQTPACSGNFQRSKGGGGGRRRTGKRVSERKKENEYARVCIRMYVRWFNEQANEGDRRRTGDDGREETNSRLLEPRQRSRGEDNLGMRARARARGWSYLRSREGRQAQGPWLHHLPPLGAGHPSADA